MGRGRGGAVPAFGRRGTFPGLKEPPTKRFLFVFSDVYGYLRIEVYDYGCDRMIVSGRRHLQTWQLAAQGGIGGQDASLPLLKL